MHCHRNTLQQAIASSSGTAAEIANIQRLGVLAEEAVAATRTAQGLVASTAEAARIAELALAGARTAVQVAIAGVETASAFVTWLVAAVPGISAAAAEVAVVVTVAVSAYIVGTAIGTIVQASVEATDEYLAQFKECGESPDWLRDLISGGNFIGDPLALVGLLVRGIVGDEELKRMLPNLLVPNIPIPAHWLFDIFGPLFVRRDPLVLDLNGGGVPPVKGTLNAPAGKPKPHILPMLQR
jgi:hypothetical protein